MGRKQKKEKAPKRVVIRGKRSDKVILDQFTRKFRRIIQSQGIVAAEIWLAKNSVCQIGRGKDTGRTIRLPLPKFRAIMDKAFESKTWQADKVRI